MEGVKVPEFFLCPISLQVMKDPVTTVTGITYDRQSIEKWLFSDAGHCDKVCPVTNQPLPKSSSVLTPNHNLRRLIQSWCTMEGVQPLPTPRAPISDDVIERLLRDLSNPRLVVDTLKRMETMASDSETNRRCMVVGGVVKHLVSHLVLACNSQSCVDESTTIGWIEQALRILSMLRAWSIDEGNYDQQSVSNSRFVDVNHDSVESLTRILNYDSLSRESKTCALLLLKSMFLQVTDSNSPSGGLNRLKPEFIRSILRVLRARIDPQTTKAALHVLLMACSWGTNNAKIVDAGAVADLIELELASPDKRTSELNLGTLDRLCSCADGREHFLKHAAAIAMVTKRILRVSPAADGTAVGILTTICKFSPKAETLREMLRVGAVSKLCMVLQANCATNVKEKARLVLRLHSDVWKDSPCIAVYLLPRYAHH